MMFVWVFVMVGKLRDAQVMRPSLIIRITSKHHYYHMQGGMVPPGCCWALTGNLT
jgi:hypothetical protein